MVTLLGLKLHLLRLQSLLILEDIVFAFGSQRVIILPLIAIESGQASLFFGLLAFRRDIKPERRRLPDNEIAYMDHRTFISLPEALHTNDFVAFWDSFRLNFISMIASIIKRSDHFKVILLHIFSHPRKSL